MSAYTKAWLMLAMVPLPLIGLIAIAWLDLVPSAYTNPVTAGLGLSFVGLWLASGIWPRCQTCREPVILPEPGYNGIKLLPRIKRECACGTDLTRNADA